MQGKKRKCRKNVKRKIEILCNLTEPPFGYFGGNCIKRDPTETYSHANFSALLLIHLSWQELLTLNSTNTCEGPAAYQAGSGVQSVKQFP